MKNLYPLCLSLLLLACSPAEKTSSSSDTTAIDSISSAPEISSVSSPNESMPDSLISVVNNELTGADTLYNIMARAKLLAGEFQTVIVITENFLDVNRLAKPGGLIAALIQTAYGEYSGSNSDIQFATIDNTLAVFDPSDNMKLVTYVELLASDSYGLNFMNADATSIELVPGQEAAEIHFNSGEAGAGDYQTHKYDVTIYALVNGVISDIFSYNSEDYVYSSDEVSSSSTRTISTSFTLGDLGDNKLPSIQTVTSTESTYSSEDEDESDKEPAQVADVTKSFTFDGKTYIENNN